MLIEKIAGNRIARIALALAGAFIGQLLLLQAISGTGPFAG